MFRPRPANLLLYLCLLLVPFGASSSLADDYKVGDKVVAIGNTELRLPGKTVGTVNRGDVLVIEHIKGKWLWVRTGETRGWIDSGKVEAVADYSKAIQLTPDDAIIYHDRSMAWQAKDDLDRAIEDTSSAIQLTADEGSYLRHRARLWESKRDLDQAISDYTEAIRIDSHDHLAFGDRGLVWFKKGDVDRAVADFDEAIRLEPDSTDTSYFYGNRGVARFDKGKPNQALADYSAAIRLNPDHAQAYINRAILRAELGELTAALADYDEAIRIAPNMPVYYMYRGNTYFDIWKYDEAIADYSRAIRLNPKMAVAYLRRGAAWTRKGDLQRAISDYSESIHADPQLREAYYNRSIAKKVTGDLSGSEADIAAGQRLGFQMVRDEIEPGDVFVTRDASILMDGVKRLGEVGPGVEVTAEQVSGFVVLVRLNAHDTDSRGWVPTDTLIRDPRRAFVQFFVGYLTVLGSADRIAVGAEKRFQIADEDNDGLLDLSEFRVATAKRTLNDLNNRLRNRLDELRKELSGVPQDMLKIVLPGALQGDVIREFEGWVRVVRIEEERRLAEAFYATGDIRDHPLAQELCAINTENTVTRFRRAHALFLWTDTNDDNVLSTTEFRLAVNGPLLHLDSLLQDLDAVDSEASSRAAHVLARIFQVEPAYVRVAVAKRLAAAPLGYRVAIAPLRAALRDRHGHVREFAATALGSIGRNAKGAIPELRSLLQNDVREVRHAAREALRKIDWSSPQPETQLLASSPGQPDLPRLARELEHEEGSIRLRAAQQLSAVGEAAVPVLVKALKHKKYSVRLYAVMALGEIGSDASTAVAALNELLDDKEEAICSAAEEALRKISSKR